MIIMLNNIPITINGTHNTSLDENAVRPTIIVVITPASPTKNRILLFKLSPLFYAATSLQVKS